MDVMIKGCECSKGGCVVSYSVSKFPEHNANMHPLHQHGCKKCPNKFMYYGDMKDHLRKDHAKFLCVHCTKHELNSFCTRTAFKRHYKVEHTFEKVKCSYCANKFLTPRLRDLHMSVWHVNALRGEGPGNLKCVNCSLSGPSLDDHNRTEHPDLKFKCTCTNVFKSKGSRKKHKYNCHIRA